jgi:ParB/RepB/Spo0J family partition protein
VSAVAESLRKPKRNRPTGSGSELLKHRNGSFYAPIGSIKIEDKFNVRKNVQPDEELIASIAEHGILNPIHVRWKDNEEKELYVVDGERRYRAAKITEWTEVPVVCRGHIDYRDALVISLSTNEGQLPLTREEKAEGFRRLRKSGMEPWEISHVMACSERMVVETLRLLDKATAPIRKGVLVKGNISRRAGSRAALLPPESQEKVSKKIVGKTTEEALVLIREEEEDLGVIPKGTRLKMNSARRGAKKTPALKPSDVIARLRRAEKALKETLVENPSSRTAKAQMRLCQVLRGTEPVSYLAAPKGKGKYNGR